VRVIVGINPTNTSPETPVKDFIASLPDSMLRWIWMQHLY